MVTQVPSPAQKDIIYPDSDGQPMADNTKQFNWIVAIKLGLELLFANNPNVFVAGNLLGQNKQKPHYTPFELYCKNGELIQTNYKSVSYIESV